MNEELMESTLKRHTERLNEHTNRISKLEQDQTRVDVKIEYLCEQIGQLVSVMKWYIGLMVGALISFFFYAIQNNLFK